MLCLDFTLVHCIKLLFINFLKYNNIRIKIKQDLKELQRIFITLNA